MLCCIFQYFYIRESSLSPLNTMKKLNRLTTVDNVNGVLQLESGSEVMGCYVSVHVQLLMFLLNSNGNWEAGN